MNQREIKFRVWDGKRMDQVTSIRHLFQDMYKIGRHDGLGGEELLDEDKVVLMQFTGMRDKNGKEIYEGDILVEELNNEKKYSVVIFAADYEFSITPLEYYPRENDSILGIIATEYPEIIGNIYENSELLK